jgi:catechol 2,3-dioxygenase-like lactoylglutathione lyase family enzyme
MIDHIGINVSDVAKSKKFYASALAPLGYKALMEFPEGAGFGEERAVLWILARPPVSTSAHVAFSAKKRQVVRDFHAAALKAGGKDNGEPGVRENYSPNYYGAFVLDPDGNNIEVVCLAQES